MARLEIPRHVVEGALVEADVESSEDDFADVIYTDYSGRGMYGATCLGIVVPSRSDAPKVVGYLAVALAEEDGDVDALLDEVATDSMGRDTIVYFRGVELVP
jgi:hypothetical protein